MERPTAFMALAAAAVIVVLIGALAMSFTSLSAANDELEHYREQQRQTALAITALHAPDTQAARAWWTSTHQDEYRRLQAEGVTVEADYIDTPYYTASLDPARPYEINMGPRGNAAPGELIIGLGQYYAGNMSKASGWTARYRLNASTREVSGFTAVLAQQIAYDYYAGNIAKDASERLGVSADAVQGSYPATLDTSYLPASGTWLDVTEYRYAFRNTDKPAYLAVKTYINGSTGAVENVEVSQPYYTTQSTVIH